MLIWDRPKFAGPGLKRRFSYEAFSPRSMAGDTARPSSRDRHRTDTEMILAAGRAGSGTGPRRGDSGSVAAHEFKVNADRHGLPPGKPPDSFALAEHRRPEHAAYLDGFFQPRFLHALEAQAPRETSAIRRLPFGWSLSCETKDGPDNSHLQFALGFIRAMFEQGARAVVDADTALWFLPDHLSRLLPGGRFSVLPFVTVIIEARPAPVGPYLIHTRGLVKFGRPDLAICRVPQRYLGHAQTLLYTVSNYLALGAHLKPGETMSLKGSPRLIARPYPREDPLKLSLGNEAMLLLDDQDQSPEATKWLSWWAEHEA